MAFKLLHTSDWHIGKPFGRFAPEVAGVLRHARLKACDRLAAAARAGGARHVLVAGDVYDRPGLSDRDVRAPLEQMRAHADLVWHVIPGNHDPAEPGGVWDRVAQLGLPPNVRLHLHARPVEIESGTWLLPAPLAARALSSDPTAWMDDAPTPAGAIRLGLAHGSIQGFGSERSASIAIAPDRPRRAGLDYLALGDWHGAKQIGPRAAYSGTPEPDAFLDNEPGFALLVSVDGQGAEPRIERAPIGEYRWQNRVFDGAHMTELARLQGEIEGLAAAARQMLLRVEIAGRLTIGEERHLRCGLDLMESRVFHLERDVQRMSLRAETDDIDSLPDGGLREVARELSELAAAESDPNHPIAARALRHLFEIAEKAGAEHAGGGR